MHVEQEVYEEPEGAIEPVDAAESRWDPVLYMLYRQELAALRERREH